jgi:hypothetical protein
MFEQLTLSLCHALQAAQPKVGAGTGDDGRRNGSGDARRRVVVRSVD